MLMRWLLKQWYEKKFSWFSFFFLLEAYLFQMIVVVRRWLYKLRIFRSTGFNVPIVVVGNICVGGTGKTPLVIALYFLLKRQGFKPGIVSRGYGGVYQNLHWVMADSNPRLVGDEPVLIANRTGAPVVVARQRVKAVAALLSDTDCDIVLCDDGLQHYALKRDIEIAVVDGKRGYGNGLCLPAGPLREPISRLDNIDFLIQNGTGDFSILHMYLIGSKLISVADNGRSHGVAILDGETIHAIAAIGHPERFFDYLEGLGAKVIRHAFKDHHQFKKSDLIFNDEYLIVMTEKDAVKCRYIANDKMWFLPVEAKLPKVFEEEFLSKIEKV